MPPPRRYSQFKQMVPIGPLSELEYLILALMGDGASSGYAIRKEMNRLKGGRWSSDSGSVYRVLRRMESYGLVTETARIGVKNRERTEYRLTEPGERVVKEWMEQPPEPADYAYLVDPLRTRSYFLTTLPPNERVRVVKDWLATSRAFAIQLDRDLQATAFGDPIYDAAYRNLHYHALARVAWLKSLLVVVKQAAATEQKSND